MKVLITGANGQLGRSLQGTAPAGVELVACGRDRMDITSREQVDRILAEERPSVVINAAAYTAVDRAESDVAGAEALNATAVSTLADAAVAVGARLVHVSTDFVFDGQSGRPYRPEDATNPLGVYGRTKLAGEQRAGSDALIVRTAWVYAPVGTNFVRTMLRLMGTHPQVRVVADQIGTPTYAPGLAQAIWHLTETGERGIFHYTDSGAASWYDFAVAIQEEAVTIGLLDRSVPVIPVSTADFPTPAARPSYSVLDKTRTWATLGTSAQHWRVNLRTMLREIKTNG